MTVAPEASEIQLAAQIAVTAFYMHDPSCHDRYTDSNHSCLAALLIRATLTFRVVAPDRIPSQSTSNPCADGDIREWLHDVNANLEISARATRHSRLPILSGNRDR